MNEIHEKEEAVDELFDLKSARDKAMQNAVQVFAESKRRL